MRPLLTTRGAVLATVATGLAAAALLVALPVGPHARAQDADPARRVALLEDTRTLGPENELLRYLSHGDPRIRARACVAVGRIQAPEAVPALRDRLRDGDAGVRREAAFALGQIALLHPEAYLPASGVAQEVIALLASLAREDDAGLRRVVAESLGKIGGEPARKSLAGMAGDADEETRLQAALGLARMRTTDVLPPLRLYQKDASHRVRAAAAYGIGRFDGPLQVADLRVSAKDPHPLVRFFAFQEARRSGRAEAMPLFVSGIGDADVRVRVEVLRGLAPDPPAGVLPKIASSKDAESFHERAALAECLGRIPGAEATEFLQGLSKDPSQQVRAAAALAWAHRTDGLEPLLVLAADPHFHVRGRAAEALGQVIREGLAALRESFAAPLLGENGRHDAAAVERASLLLGSPLWAGDLAEPPGVETIRGVTADDPPALRAAAARAAASHQALATTLAARLEDDDPWVRAEASLSAGPGEEGASPPDDLPDSVRAILEAVRVETPDNVAMACAAGLADESPAARRLAARALRSAGAPALPLVVQALGDGTPAVAEEALRTAIELAPDPEALAEPLTAAAGHVDRAVRLRLAWLVAGIDAPYAGEILRRLTQDPSVEVRDAAELHLAWVSGVPPSSRTTVDRAWADAAGRLAGLGRAWAALRGLAAGGDVRVAATALEAMAQVPGHEVERRHLVAIGSKDPGIAYQGARFFQAHRSVDATTPLRTAYATWLVPGYEEVSLEVTKALDATDDPRAVPTLGKALSHPDPLVRAAAEAAFRDGPWERPEADEPPAIPPSPYLSAPAPAAGELVVILETDRGDLRLELLPDAAPIHVKNLVRLVKEGFYDRKIFHRVVPSFVIQGGDPLGTGWGNAGLSLRDEINHEKHVAGAVGMPKAGKDTGGCQLFINHVPIPRLDGAYTVFGRVTRGLEVLDAIEVGDRIVRARFATPADDEEGGEPEAPGDGR